MARQLMLTAFVCLLTLMSTKAQIREVPDEVEQVFTAQYAGAEDIAYKDHLLNVKVHFTLKGEKMVATYTNKGLWKETEKTISFDQLPDEVKDGFQKSKYFDWKVVDTKMLYRPYNVELYRLKVEANEIKKKNLLFTPKGRLQEDEITL